MLLVLGLLLVGGAIALLALALKPSGGVHRSLALIEALEAAPAELVEELEPSFADRVLVPLRGRALRLGHRLTGADSAARMRRKLDLAGNPGDWSVDKVVSSKVLCAGLGLLAAATLAHLLGAGLPVGLGVAIAGAAIGFFGPDLFLYQRAYDRAEKLRRALPDAIDLMAISVEAGLGFDAAVQQVARNTGGPLAEEFARMLREMQLGTGRAEALRGLGERTSVEEVRSFVGAMVQADAFGIPVGQVLRVQSAEIRVKRRQWAETKAQQVPVKMTVPLIFCILPCLFVVIMGPAALRMMDTL